MQDGTVAVGHTRHGFVSRNVRRYSHTKVDRNIFKKRG